MRQAGRLYLLAAGGFAPQLSIQAFLGLIALWLLVNAAGPQAQGIQVDAAARSNSPLQVARLEQS